jgi:SAM-dependent methyltransferase
MNIFQKYANYYDNFYKDKDYKKECDFLEKIFKKHSERSVHSILDLGCGTGSHSLILAKRGYETTGVDLSSQMIEAAKSKNTKGKAKIDFFIGDIRKINLKKTFDAVISMFAVVSYLTTNKDLLSAFQTAAAHLEKKGIFVFDFWFGPAVLSEKPQPRFKVIENGDKKIIRLSAPVLDSFNHTVSLKFEIIEIFKNKIQSDIKEIHTIRFFFPEEIKNCLEKSGFKMIKICPFGDLNKTPSVKDWNVMVIAEKI